MDTISLVLLQQPATLAFVDVHLITTRIPMEHVTGKENTENCAHLEKIAQIHTVKLWEATARVTRQHQCWTPPEKLACDLLGKNAMT